MSRALSMLALAALGSVFATGAPAKCSGDLIPTLRQEALAAQQLRDLFQDSMFLRWGVRIIQPDR